MPINIPIVWWKVWVVNPIPFEWKCHCTYEIYSIAVFVVDTRMMSSSEWCVFVDVSHSLNGCAATEHGSYLCRLFSFLEYPFDNNTDQFSNVMQEDTSDDGVCVLLPTLWHRIASKPTFCLQSWQLFTLIGMSPDLIFQADQAEFIVDTMQYIQHESVGNSYWHRYNQKIIVVYTTKYWNNIILWSILFVATQLLMISLTDFSLEAILHCKQYRKLEKLVNPKK
jgi:hypothetical protein